MSLDQTSRSAINQSRDSVELEVIKNALEGIADGMANTIVRTSRSSVVRSGLDFSTGLLDRKGELIAQGMCYPMHLGGMMPALEACLAWCKDDVRPGDIFANNDPYEGGSHLPDIFLYKPIFVDEVLVAYACAMAHQTDIGGRVAGGNACDSTEIYQEGLRIPPTKLYSQGQANETLFRLLERAVRVPQKVLGDVHAQVAALTYGEREFVELVRRNGLERTSVLMGELVDYTELLTRQALTTLPDGSWKFTDYVDDDGITDQAIPIVVTLTKHGDRLLVDFTGTGPQCKGAIQPVFATTKAMVYCALKNILGLITSEIPNTGGYFRPVSVVAPEGTFVNPRPPASVAARALGCIRIHQAVLGAFAQMLPDRIYACSGGCEYGISLSGYDHSKVPSQLWVQLEFYIESAVGGSAYRDGQDAQNGGSSNTATIPVETIELENPLLIEEFGLIPDSEGPGMHRGGQGIVRQYRFLMDDSQIQMRCDRTSRAPYGLSGGKASRTTNLTLSVNGKPRKMPGKFITEVNRGAVLRVEMPGAGGWGDPLERDPSLVLEDVIAEKISLGRARSTYGVVVDVEKRIVDWAATKELRQESS